MAQEIKNHYIHLNSASTSATTKNSQNKNAIMEFYINNIYKLTQITDVK